MDSDLSILDQLVLNSTLDYEVDSEATPSVDSTRHDWELVFECKTEYELVDYLYDYSHKMTSSHGNQKSKCLFHSDGHSQLYGYYACTSVRCHKNEEDKCPVRFRKNKCTRDNSIYLYSVGEHLNKYEETDTKKRPGIHYFYKQEIDKLFSDNRHCTPFSILRTLTKRRLESCAGYDKEIPLPTIEQLRNYKRRHAGRYTKDTEDEYKQVNDLINELSIDGSTLDETKAFSYGTKLGVGSDNDPFICCFSSKHLLRTISRYSNHYSIFHIDGTYKLVKNRFPVIAYGRSDSNGRLHLISIAICSDETTETYKHFYKETMKICIELDINFVVPTYIIQDASHSEANAATSVFGPNIIILMCWFHMIFNVKKHESLKEVTHSVKEMVIVDLTRLHYCLEYEFETYSKIVIAKWKTYPELELFVAYVIPQWFVGTFCNWHIFKSPPGFATTNNPMESFNKIIKARFTNFETLPLIAFILVIIEHLIPFYSENVKEFLFYRIPHKKTIAVSSKLSVLALEMKGFLECTYKGLLHTHTINFNLMSCTCRWFRAFAVCAHLICACDRYNRELKGYTKPKVFVFRPKRGRKPKALTFTEAAFRSNPMPVIVPIITGDNRPNLFLKDTNNMPGLPSINASVPVEAIVSVGDTTSVSATTVRILRSYRKTKEVVDKPGEVKRLQKSVVTPVVGIVKAKRGRPKKNAPALSIN